jgi:type IV pilus assembly protein PilW
VRSSFGVAVGDVMVAAPAAWTTTNGCTMFSVEQDTSIADTTLSATRVPHVPGGNASWNKDLPSIFPSSGYTDSSILLNLGGIAKRKYAVSTDGTLEIESLTSTGAAPTTQNMYSQIVLLKALYGRDTNNDNVIDTYDANTPTTAAGWAQVRAVRVAIVARSAQREKDVVSTTPAWNVSTGAAVSYVDAASGSTTACAAAAATCSLPLTVNHLTDWAHYRYKVYDTVIPLRNVLWNS